MLIVEGPDGAGKTVLVGQLSKSFSSLAMVPDVHAAKGETVKKTETRRIGSTRSRTYSAIGEAFKGTRPLVHDRLFYSEMIYGATLRGKVQFSPVEVEFIQGAFKLLQCPIIMCLPPFPVVEHNVHNTEDHLDGVNEHVEELYGGYLALVSDLSRSEVNFIGYDYTRKTDFEELVKRIGLYLERRKDREA